MHASVRKPRNSRELNREPKSGMGGPMWACFHVPTSRPAAESCNALECAEIFLARWSAEYLFKQTESELWIGEELEPQALAR